MVSIRDLDDDYYVYDEKNYCILGRRTKNKYQMGDKVKIEIKNVNLAKKQIDFSLINGNY